MLIFDAAVVAKCGHRFHVRCIHLWLTEGDADNEWNQMSTLAQTTTPLLVYTIDLHDRLILHRGWPTGLNDVKEDFHRRFPHDTQKDDSYWDANTCWCKKNSDSSNPCQAVRDSDDGLPGYNFTFTMRKPPPYQSPKINHLFQDARARTHHAGDDRLPRPGARCPHDQARGYVHLPGVHHLAYTCSVLQKAEHVSVAGVGCYAEMLGVAGALARRRSSRTRDGTPRCFNLPAGAEAYSPPDSISGWPFTQRATAWDPPNQNQWRHT
mmetsp:Transcript_16201/g.40754  ORF Transcript_16201/g.40754 Transcript_16201/m.40754 type:complete len:266 (+) Transcript_16201:761-1558(+)